MTTSEPAGATRGRPPVTRLRIHNGIVDRLDLSAGDVLLDVGCGAGLTMATAATRMAGVSLIGLDIDEPSLREAASWLDELGAASRLVRADLDAPLPLATASVTHVVCHDVLECLRDPGALLAEASRVLQPGGTAVWSHVDYDSIVVGGADRALTRAVLRAYADAPPPGGRRSDPQMGRRLTALIANSPLTRTAIDAVALVAADLDGPAAHRLRDISDTVRRTGTGPDVDRWMAELRAADGRGEFFYAQTAYLVVTVSPG